MNSLIRRSKMVSFRLSLAEYCTLREACDAQSARSVSDLARMAMQKLIACNGQADGLSGEIQELRDRVRLISNELDRLSKVVQARNPCTGRER